MVATPGRTHRVHCLAALCIIVCTIIIAVVVAAVVLPAAGIFLHFGVTPTLQTTSFGCSQVDVQ
jgi:hypothetical protein